MTAYVKEPFTIKELAEKASEASEVPIPIHMADAVVARLITCHALEAAGINEAGEVTFQTPHEAFRLVPIAIPKRNEGS